jgi:hypothetical protein
MPYFDQKFLYTLYKDVKLLKRNYEYLYAKTSGDITTETDPIFSVSAAAGIQSSDITNWNSKQTGSTELTALAGLSAVGLVTRTASNTYTSRTLTGTTNLITVTNGNGVSGNPTITVGANVVQTTATQTLTNKTLTSPVLDGSPTATTATSGDSSTRVATTAFVTTALNARVAAHVDPTTGTVEQIVNALIAAGLMAAS